MKAPLIALLLCLPSVVVPVQAAVLSFSEAQQLALTQSRKLQASDAAITAAREMAVAAGQRPDPVLRFGIDNVPVNTDDRYSLTKDFMTMRRIGVMQEFTRSDKRKLRQQRQEREAELGGAEKTVEQSDILRASGKAWLESYYLAQMQALVGQQLQQTQQQLVATEAAYRGGRNRQDDVLAAHSEVLLLEDQLSEMQRRQRIANAALARWVGAEQAARTLTPEGTPDINHLHFDAHNLESHLDRHPDLMSLARRVDIAETDVKLAEANKQVDWQVELSYAQRGSNFSDMASIGVSAPLQWDQGRRQNRELAARMAQVEQAKALRDDLYRAHVAELRTMVDSWETDRQRLVRYQTQLVPLAEQRTLTSLASYRGGKATLTEALMARRNALAMKLQALQLTLQTASEWVELNFLLPDTPLLENAGSTT